MSLKIMDCLPDDNRKSAWRFEDFREKNGEGVDVGKYPDLRRFSIGRHHQSQTGSCVANAIVKAIEIRRVLMHGESAHRDLSRLALYYWARHIQRRHDPSEDDNGTRIGRACDAAREYGIPLESDWPFRDDLLFEQPDEKAMMSAVKIGAHYRINRIPRRRKSEVIRALRMGYPVVFGCAVGKNWHSYRPGEVLGPAKRKHRTGRHATVIVGWDGENFIGENSWGESWGDDGCYRASPSLIRSWFSNDFWVIVD
jgi:C1A family cysteine protease